MPLVNWIWKGLGTGGRQDCSFGEYILYLDLYIYITTLLLLRILVLLLPWSLIIFMWLRYTLILHTAGFFTLGFTTWLLCKLICVSLSPLCHKNLTNSLLLLLLYRLVTFCFPFSCGSFYCAKGVSSQLSASNSEHYQECNLCQKHWA